jgi:hypothetical protein
MEENCSVARWPFSKPNLGEFGVLEVVWHFLAFLAFFWLFRYCLTFFKKMAVLAFFWLFSAHLKKIKIIYRQKKKTKQNDMFQKKQYIFKKNIFFSHQKLPAKVPNMHFKFKIYYPQG